MNRKKLNRLFALIQDMPDSPQNQEFIDLILELINENTALKAKPNQPATPAKKEKLYLKFTDQEIDSMPDSVRKLLLKYKYVITYRFHNGVYQARYRREGYNIDVSSSDLNILKRKFIDKLSANKPEVKKSLKYPLLKDFLKEWLDVKKITVKASTYKSYCFILNTHILPTFGNKTINTITRAEIQKYLISLINDNKNRTAQKLKQLLSAIFDVAVIDFNIKNPLCKVELPHFESKRGCTLTKTEEKELVEYCILHQTHARASAILILLYTGMRAGELKSAVLNKNYILCITEKTRKGYADELRKIPITPMLRKVMPYIDFEKAKKIHPDTSRGLLKEVLPNHHLHDLRYTFITRAKEAGCNHEIVMLWDGHKFDRDVSSSAVDRRYTTYSDEYYFNEAKKIDYEL